jgi:oxygen-dependent protoporphyrinogen oxidase
MKRIVIIGGGITGLAAAHRIVEQVRASGEAVDLKLLEAGSRLGGIVQTQERDGFLIENGPDSFISEKPAALELAKRLGLKSHLIETNQEHRRSFIVRKGKLLPVPEGFQLLAPGRFWPFVKSDIFSWSGKARMALDLVLPRRKLNGNEEESLAQFVRRRLGQEALERMAQPMVGGIYTADPEQLSLRATMPRFLEMEREHGSLIRALRKQVARQSADSARQGSGSAKHGAEFGASGARYSLFLSFDRGMQVLTDKLVERISNLRSEISDSGSEISNFKSQIPELAALNQSGALSPSGALSQNPIQLNTKVESITLEYASFGRETESAGATSVEAASVGKRSTQWRLIASNNQTLIADAVCLALPAYVSAHLLGNLDAQLAAELAGISYASSATINLGYQRTDIPHPLDGFGFVVPFIERRSLIACTFSSVKFAGRAPQSHVVLRAFVGGALQPELIQLDQDEMLARVLHDLRDLLGIERAPLFSEVTKWERSMPQYHLGHLERVKRIEERIASLPGLVLAGNAYTGTGIPDCVRSGEAAADQINRLFAAGSRG